MLGAKSRLQGRPPAPVTDCTSALACPMAAWMRVGTGNHRTLGDGGRTAMRGEPGIPLREGRDGT